jgi:diguanylate cyclase (GGDEF)-like protein
MAQIIDESIGQSAPGNSNVQILGNIYTQKNHFPTHAHESPDHLYKLHPEYLAQKSTEIAQVGELQTHTTNAEIYQTILSNTPTIFFTTNKEGILTITEGQGLQVLGRRPGQNVGRSIFDLYRHVPALIHAVHRALEGETLREQIQIGSAFFEALFMPLFDSKQQITGMMAVATDVSEQTLAKNALEHQALYDPLTDLPNRNKLFACITDALPKAEQTKEKMILLILDLNRFKEINDTFGHQCGDLLLQQFGKRLQHIINESATIARLGGDEFAIFLPDADKARAQQIASTIEALLDEPFQIEDYSLHIESSIGIALYPEHGSDALTLYRHADVAMYLAKQGHERCVLYDAKQDHYNPQRLAYFGDLRKAITTQELCLHYQPKIDLKTGHVESVEALVRWQHPVHGMIPPDQFIPLAEQTGLIIPLTQWVIQTAVKQCRDWLDQGIVLSIAINLSMWNLRDKCLPDIIAGTLAHYQVSPHLLYIEVTESAVMTDIEQTIQVLKHLVSMGIRMAIDDYGTGYSSLFYLKNFPAHELKIDRAFVQHLAMNKEDLAIVQSTITMAHSLGMCVVAEGVEDQASWDLLTGFGCDTIQGYYLSRPLPAEKLEHWLELRKAIPLLS